MPKFHIPTDENQYDLWKEAVACKKGTNSVEKVSAVQKCRLKQTFFVENDTLKCIKTRKPVVIANHIPELLRLHHDEKGHPGRDSTVHKLK